MKKILFLGAMAAMLLGTASCSNDMEPAMGGEVPVSFAIDLGDNIESRTISDGTGANQLKFAVFENGTEITALAQTVDVADKKATINTKLVKGHTYSFVFWAQNSACTAYNTTNMSAIKVDYTANCNDESRDAFYKMDSFKVTEPFEKEEVLTRPFAQINFLADDAAGVLNVDAYKSKVTVTGVPTTLNTLDGTVGTETTDVTFDYATIISSTEKLEGYESYRYVAMNYILAATDKALKNKVELTVNDGSHDVNTVTVTDCPVQRNYRTNIFGSLFTLEGKFNITIDPIYTGDLEVLPEPWDGSIEDPVVDGNNVTINNAAQLAGLARDVNSGNNYAGKTVTLTADLNLDNKPWTPIGNVHAYSGQAFHGIFDGQGHTIYNMSCTDDYPKWSTAALFGSISNGTIMNLIIKNATIISKHYAAAVCGYKGDGTSCTISNCSAINCSITSTAETVEGELDNGDKVGGIIGYAADPTIIKNCTVDGCTISAVRDCAGIAGYLGDASNFTGNKVINTSVTANQKNQYAYHPEAYGYVGVFRGRQGDTGLDASNTKSNVTLIFISTDGDETNVQQ